MRVDKVQADSAFAHALAREMMFWHGNLPRSLRFYEAGVELWTNLPDLVTNRSEDVPRIRALLVEEAAEALARYVKTGRGIRRASQAAAYANVLQWASNDRAGKPLFDGMPFPLPDGWFEEVPPDGATVASAVVEGAAQQ